MLILIQIKERKSVRIVINQEKVMSGFSHIPFWSIAWVRHIPMPFCSNLEHNWLVLPTSKTPGTTGCNLFRIRCDRLSRPGIPKSFDRTLVQMWSDQVILPYFWMCWLHSQLNLGAIGPLCLDTKSILHHIMRHPN